MGQRGRENRDLAEQRSARTRLSLRLIFPQVTRCFCFAPQKKSNETRLYASPYGKGRWCEAPEGIRKSAFKRATRKTGETIPPSTSPLCTRGLPGRYSPFAQGGSNRDSLCTKNSGRGFSFTKPISFSTGFRGRGRSRPGKRDCTAKSATPLIRSRTKIRSC